MTGTSHQKLDHGCDDAHAYRKLDNETLLLAVADGAGSASRSAEGASYTVQESLVAAEYMLAQQAEPTNEREWKDVLSDILRTTRTTLEKFALGNGEATNTTAGETVEEIPKPGILPLRAFATTFLLTIVTSQWIAITQIGDGAVVVQYDDGTLEALTQPDHGEYINETSFITDPDYLKRTQYIILPQVGIHGIALLTDGLQMLALDFTTNRPYEPFFMPLFRFAARPETTELELKTFLASERVCARTDDDKTLILGVRL